MNKNIRIASYILIVVIFWMLSAIFVEEEIISEKKPSLFKVAVQQSESQEYQPKIRLKSTTRSEARVEVKAKTSGEVVSIGARQGTNIKKDFVLCSLGVVELNRTEVKAPFDGYIENIVKPGNYLQKGQICATIIQLDPIIFIAEVPEFQINKVKENQKVKLDLITGQTIEGKLSFVSKSANNATRTFLVESEIPNENGLIRDGITSNMTIYIDKVIAHKIPSSILVLSDEGKLGVRYVNNDNIVQFSEVIIFEDSNDGLWVAGLPSSVNLIVEGQGFVEEGQAVLINTL